MGGGRMRFFERNPAMRRRGNCFTRGGLGLINSGFRGSELSLKAPFPDDFFKSH